MVDAAPAFSIFMGWALNMLVTGIFAFLVFAWPSERLFPAAYYHVYQPKRLKQIGKIFRIELFRKFLLTTIWRAKARQKTYFNGRADGLENLDTQSKKSEFGHVIPFVLLLLISIYLLVKGLIIYGVSTFLFNWIGNLYPVILQRNHRMRMAAILARSRRRA